MRGISMCGIVGHLGSSHSIDLVLEGLKRLEYRGYDSAGISFNNQDGALEIFKKEGKLENLVEFLGQTKAVNALSCIGHTRWATHGEVSDANSHPHTDGGISIVHNGIIENAESLRADLIKQGYKFRSQTDSEVFLAMLSLAVAKGTALQSAITHSFEQLHGNSAFVILDSKTSDIWAIKKGAPLVCGIHEVNSDALVSSDPYALVGFADKLYFPQDGVICHLSAGNKNIINFYELNGEKSERYMSKKQEMSLEVSDKGSFDHFMLKEIYEQPGLIRGLTKYYFDGEGSSILNKVGELKPGRFLVNACGTAYYAGLVVKDFIEKFNRIPCQVDLASEFRYRNPLILKNDVGLFVSQSGDTADTLAAQALCRDEKIATVSIVNVEGSTLFRDCNFNLLIRAGIEIGVASTKAFTQQALTGRLLSHAIGDGQDKSKLKDKFNLLATRIDELLSRAEELKSIAESIHNYKGFFYTGRGSLFPVALEGALKLKEIAYVHAEGYASGELKHGPIALIDEEMVNIALVSPELLDKTISNVEEIKARKGKIVVLGPEGDANSKRVADYFFPLNYEGLDELGAIYCNVANQLLAYYMAKFKGTDIDKPRNLAKSVTVE
ncbi:MAG: glutamine--fructose-6-phosphate transaminase (isomerizing) [Halobacteriovorax sp.]|nr:glutamine--fructose-6-phosphate transaminase (isomerizing) [Halobacteriovorax sp.]